MGARSLKPLPVHTGCLIADTVHLNAPETGALALLMMAAWGRPHRRLADDDRELARLARLSLPRWLKRKSAILQGWRLRGGQWEINPRYLATAVRPPIAPAVRARVLSVACCSYCGTNEGPFEVDHTFPHAEGGSSEEENLACACVPCNRGKGDRSAEEWRAILARRASAPLSPLQDEQRP